jgi:hypothetical protein
MESDRGILEGEASMRPLMNIRHRHTGYFEPHPMFSAFSLFATMILAAVVVIFLGWLVAR